MVFGGRGPSHRAPLSARAAFCGQGSHVPPLRNHAQWRRAFAARCGAAKSRRAPARGSAALLPTHPPSAAPRAPAKRAQGPASPADCPPRHGGNLWLAAPKGSGDGNEARMTAGAISRRHAPWHPAQGPWQPPGRDRRANSCIITASQAVLRRKELSSLCVFGVTGRKTAHKTIIFSFNQGRNQLLALCTRAARASAAGMGVLGTEGTSVPFWPQLGAAWSASRAKSQFIIWTGGRIFIAQ